MATVVEDLIQGSSASFDRSGHTYDRPFHVDGLTGSASQMLYEAKTATGIPAINSRHPANAVMFCKSIRASMTGDRSAQVICHYESLKGSDPEDPTADSATIEVGATLQQITSVMDKDNEQLWVTYTPTDADVSRQNSEVSVMRPLMTKSWSVTFEYNPDMVAAKYIGHVNSVQWKIDDAKDAKPRQWLCTEFSARTNDNGITWPTTISFTKKDLPPFCCWDEAIWWVDKATGRLPTAPAPNEGNGMKRVRVYPEADFNKLKLKK